MIKEENRIINTPNPSRTFFVYLWLIFTEFSHNADNDYKNQPVRTICSLEFTSKLILSKNSQFTCGIISIDKMEINLTIKMQRWY